jgi:hyperosmotically inducible periplasmic protein
MKTLHYVSLVIALSGPSFAWSTLGEPPENSKPPQEQKQKPSDEARPIDNAGTPRPVPVTQHLGPVERSSKLVGATVKDSSGEKVGKIRDLSIDLEGGRVLQVIINSGGVLGVGGKNVALPPTSLTVDASGDVTTTVGRQKIDAAPEFLIDQWPDSTSPDKVSALYRYYEVEPRLVPRAEISGTTPAGSIERATKLVGLPVVQESGIEIGKVNDLVIDLSSARVPIVVVSTGGFLGVGDELSSIPPSLFHYEYGRGQAVLRVAKENLQAAPHFKSSQWAEHSSPSQYHEVYRAYGVRPYFHSDSAPDNAAVNVRDRDQGNLTPLDQGNSESDIKTTADIRQSVTREDGLSVNARNVKIITQNGRVTLRGPVASLAEKERIETLAKSVVGDDKVDSQLEVVAAANPDKK